MMAPTPTIVRPSELQSGDIILKVGTRSHTGMGIVVRDVSEGNTGLFAVYGTTRMNRKNRLVFRGLDPDVMIIVQRDHIPDRRADRKKSTD